VPRVKRGVPARARHKKVLNQTEGHKGSKSLLSRRAHESLMKSLWYAYRDRRDRKRDMRRLWIVRINAGARLGGLTYGHFMHGLKNAGVTIDRKVLAELAVHDSSAFDKLVETAKAAG
jgi:large subunit ribosomal protein L20